MRARCIRCQYPAEGLSGEQCPECGHFHLVSGVYGCGVPVCMKLWRAIIFWSVGCGILGVFMHQTGWAYLPQRVTIAEDYYYTAVPSGGAACVVTLTGEGWWMPWSTRSSFPLTSVGIEVSQSGREQQRMLLCPGNWQVYWWARMFQKPYPPRPSVLVYPEEKQFDVSRLQQLLEPVTQTGGSASMQEYVEQVSALLNRTDLHVRDDRILTELTRGPRESGGVVKASTDSPGPLMSRGGYLLPLDRHALQNAVPLAIWLIWIAIVSRMYLRWHKRSIMPWGSVARDAPM